MTVGAVDIFVVVALIYSIYHGFTKGLIISLASLVGLILGVYGAIKFSGITATYLNDHWQIKIPILSFAITFIVILLTVYLLGKLLEKAVNILSLGFLNKAAGALFNGAKMILILGVLFTIFNQVNTKFNIIEQVTIEKSFSYPYLKMIEGNLLPFASELFNAAPEASSLI